MFSTTSVCSALIYSCPSVNDVSLCNLWIWFIISSHLLCPFHQHLSIQLLIKRHFISSISMHKTEWHSWTDNTQCWSNDQSKDSNVFKLPACLSRLMRFPSSLLSLPSLHAVTIPFLRTIGALLTVVTGQEGKPGRLQSSQPTLTHSLSQSTHTHTLQDTLITMRVEYLSVFHNDRWVSLNLFYTAYVVTHTEESTFDVKCMWSHMTFPCEKV